MNERIEDLMREADDVEILVDEYFLDSDFLSDIDPRRVKVFAELIIKECHSVIVKSHRGHMNPDLSWNAVKEHFGVKK